MFGIDVRTVSYLRRYCSHVSNFLRFGRADQGWFLWLVCQMCPIFDIWHIWESWWCSNSPRVYGAVNLQQQSVSMKVDKVSTLEGCFWFSRPLLSASFALRVSIMEASNTFLFVIIFSFVIPKSGTYPDKSFMQAPLPIAPHSDTLGWTPNVTSVRASSWNGTPNV